VHELGDGYGGTGVPISASVSPARARGREKRMSAREGVEVAPGLATWRERQRSVATRRRSSARAPRHAGVRTR
jgi:hypothetical protein